MTSHAVMEERTGPGRAVRRNMAAAFAAAATTKQSPAKQRRVPVKRLDFYSF